MMAASVRASGQNCSCAPEELMVDPDGHVETLKQEVKVVPYSIPTLRFHS